jgi:hypothetical protein
MRKSLSVVLALAICTGWSTAQAAGRLHPKDIEAIGKAVALAHKAINAPPPETMFKRASEGFGFVTDSLGKLALFAGLTNTSVDICTWYHWYEWCDKTTHTSNHRPHDHE